MARTANKYKNLILILASVLVLAACSGAGSGSSSTSGSGAGGGTNSTSGSGAGGGTNSTSGSAPDSQFAGNGSSLSAISSESIHDALPGIVCWGDSLTYGQQTDSTNYPDELHSLIDARLIEPIREKTGDNTLTAPEVVNLGVNTETTLEIAGRNGGVPLMVSSDFTIPAGTDPVDFEYCSSERNETTKLLRESDGGVSTVTIDSMEGRLIRWYDTAADHSRYKFQRLESGSPVQVKTGDLMLTNLYNEYLDYIPIIMMGANGGWTDDTDLEQQFQAMLNHSDSRDAWIISATPLSSETDVQIMEQEDKDMTEAFGEHAVSLRRWMIENGLETAGITPTGQDEERIAAGLTPSSLLLDDLLHFTPAGYRAMAEMYYEKMDELGFFDGLKELAR